VTNEIYERLGRQEAKIDALHEKFDHLSPIMRDHETRLRTLEAAYHRLKVVWVAGAALVGAVTHAAVRWVIGGSHGS
jgi:hypothetical protein